MKKLFAASVMSLTLFGISHVVQGAGQVMHDVHILSDRGPKIEEHWTYPDTCHLCHTGETHNGPVDYNLCNNCHSPGGAYDGVNDAEIGARNNLGSEMNPDEWVSDIYDADGNLKQGKEKWCLGCHDDGYSEIHGVAAPNIAGKTMAETWQNPVAAVDTGFQGAAALLDGDFSTGNVEGQTADLIFDLGTEKEVTHIRLWNNGPTKSNLEVYGSSNLNTWRRIFRGHSIKFGKPFWRVAGRGWFEAKIDDFSPIRYIKIVRVKSRPAALADRSFREFEYKSDISYGYEVTGHKFACDYCHDTSTIHVDGNSRTYSFSQNNYSEGYRLADVAIGNTFISALEIPRVGCNKKDNVKSDNDFALCFTCHDKYELLGDANGAGDFYKDPLMTYFTNNNNADENGNPINAHLVHLSGRDGCGNAPDWDSDWDGLADSPQSCPSCHNVHGSPNPAMTRHGELTSTPGTSDKVPMMNLHYLDVEGEADGDLMDRSQSTGGRTQFYAGAPGTVAKNNTCKMCHSDMHEYVRTP